MSNWCTIKIQLEVNFNIFWKSSLNFKRPEDSIARSTLLLFWQSPQPTGLRVKMGYVTSWVTYICGYEIDLSCSNDVGVRVFITKIYNIKGSASRVYIWMIWRKRMCLFSHYTVTRGNDFHFLMNYIKQNVCSMKQNSTILKGRS